MTTDQPYYDKPEEILRIAAKGDGVTASGRYAWGVAPGDVLMPDGSVQPGPHHVAPPCRHFGQCGGCQLQQLDEESLAHFVEARVANACTSQELGAEAFAPPHLSPPLSRRRASLRAESSGGRVVIGFREAKSHRLVEVTECHVMLPEFTALLAPLRKLLIRLGQGQAEPKGRRGSKGKHSHARMAADIEFAMTEQGVDLGIKGLKAEGLAATELLLEFARDQGLARIVLDQGFGPEALWEPEPVTVRLGAVSVPLPPGAFLQATLDGEAALVGAACEWLEGAANVADLFAGLGTFALALAGQGSRVLVVEAARDAHLACKSAAERAQVPVFAMHRDLFRNPLMGAELDKFDAVVLDPPRAGAREQVERLADSKVGRIVYISCNPSSWSRDAAMLVDAGYRLVEVRPVGQFRWSTHVELASYFIRDQ